MFRAAVMMTYQVGLGDAAHVHQPLERLDHVRDPSEHLARLKAQTREDGRACQNSPPMTRSVSRVTKMSADLREAFAAAAESST